jgi:hypothetical protein
MAQIPFNPISGVSTHQDCVNIINLNVNDSETRISALESSNSDWNSVSGLSEILNKPTLGTAAAASTGDFATAAEGVLAGTALQSVVAGTNVTIDNSNPTNPTINAGDGGHVIQDEGISLTQRTNLNFVGASVTVTDDAGSDSSIVTIAAGGGPSGTTLSGTTANATPTEIFVDGTSPNRVDVATGSTITFSALVAARSATESAGYKIEGVIKNDAGTAALVGVVAKTVFAEEDIAWDITVTAANNALTFIVTGDSVDSVSWEVTLNKIEAT